MLHITMTLKSGKSTIRSLLETESAASQTAAIQLALDSVASFGGGIVTLSAGTFTVTGTGKAADGVLRVGSHTTLEGAGMGDTIIKLADGSDGVTGIVRTDSGRLVDGFEKTTEMVTIRDLTIDGNRDATTGKTDGFYSGPRAGEGGSDYGIELSGVEIKNASRYGFDPHEDSIAVRIEYSIAHNNGVDGFIIDGSRDVTLINNSSFDNGRHGFNITTGSEGVHLIDNDSGSNGGAGIVVQTGNNEIRTPTSNVVISGGVVEGNGRAGVEIRNSDHVSVSDVEIHGNSRAGVSIKGVDTVKLVGNDISGNGKPGSEQVKIADYVQKYDGSTLSTTINSKNVFIDGKHVELGGGKDYDGVRITAHSDKIDGSDGHDAIAGGKGHDRIHGHAGDDKLFGNSGNDELIGDAGSDWLVGSSGDDRLSGGAGTDILHGGSGRDTFVVTANAELDIIRDFKKGEDRIDLTAVKDVDGIRDLKIQAVGADTHITFAHTELVLVGVKASTISSGDFLFSH